ncbi:hypothetical protein [Micromonospora sp. WMMD1082]|uniref:hypothetical protein n=1 Tax=Micromonospora sp. WMMD1082 TaxID=3016104 RepID=UPI0024164AE1|nr:hypothetical protein [Micromonospora sp. WMMD1082]MDG4794912.1 hypothetical protein [Micromonospora sp. WMMD1082]
MDGRRSSIVTSAGTRLGRVASVALLLAAAYGIALVVAGFVAPAYNTATTSASSGETTHGSDTIVGANGIGAAFVLGVPLLATVLVGCALWVRSAPSAWALTGLLAVLNLLAMASIGLFVLPVTAALVVACSARRRQPKQQNPVSAETP